MWKVISEAATSLALAVIVSPNAAMSAQ
jgi:hypothetical protein